MMLPLVLAFYLEVGYLPCGGMANYQPPTFLVVEELSFYTTLGVSASMWGFFVEGEVRTNVQKGAEGYSFMPVGVWYGFGAGYRIGWFEIGWRHECDHPVAVMFPMAKGEFRWEAALDQVYLRVEGKL